MSDCSFGRVPKDSAYKNVNVGGCDTNTSISANRIVVREIYSQFPEINPQQGPNAIAVGCGLVGNGTAPSQSGGTGKNGGHGKRHPISSRTR